MSETKKFLIYKHTNKINGKVYIGQTCKEPKKRWENGGGYVGCPYFYSAIKKYGWDGFYHEIIVTGLTLEEANKEEERLILEYESTNPTKGYNLKSGGLNNIPNEETRNKISVSHIGSKNPNYGKHPSKETIRKKSESYKSHHYTRTKELKKKLSERMTGENNPMYGKKASAETLKKMSEAHMSTKNGNTRKVKCVELNKVWDCTSDCARELNIKRPNIVNVCKRKHKTTGGYHFEYVD